MDIFKVILTEQAKRNLLKLPTYIVRKLQSWVEGIENEGLSQIRKYQVIMMNHYLGKERESDQYG